MNKITILSLSIFAIGCCPTQVPQDKPFVPQRVLGHSYWKLDVTETANPPSFSICPECKGEGTIRWRLVNNVMTVNTCKKCNGSGKIKNNCSVSLWISAEADSMNEKQLAYIKKVKSESSTISTHLVKLNKIDVVKSESPLNVNVGQCSFEVKSWVISSKDRTTYVAWNIDPVNCGNLTIIGNAISGIIYIQSKVFSVRGMGDGYALIVHIDQSKL